MCVHTICPSPITYASPVTVACLSALRMALLDGEGKAPKGTLCVVQYTTHTKLSCGLWINDVADATPTLE